MGIGVQVRLQDDGEILIVGLLDGGGAKSAGIQENDIISKVNGKDVIELGYEEAISEIRGEENTKVDITIKRSKDDEFEEIDYTITRTKLDDVSVYSEMKDNNIGYIMITEFKNNTGEQFKTHLTELTNQGMEGLILDIRCNGGGTLTAVTEVADCLMDKGVLLTMKDKSGNVKKVVETTDDTILNVPMVLLVDEYSASASEVLAGAIKDRNIGELIGETTFGKGIVQTILPLNDGSAIKVTTEKYYTPNGNYIHEKGIEPDYIIEYDTEQAQKGIDNQYNKAEEILLEKLK